MSLLVAAFEKQYLRGPVIRADLSMPARGRHVTVLFGPSGAGKTTVLRCLAGLERPQRGTIRFADETWLDAATGVHLRPQQRGIGLLFQEYALFPHLTVQQNVAYGLRRCPRGERARRVDNLLGVLELSELEGRLPDELSAGQRQRVALARALAIRPRLLLLDEPLSALDASTRQTVSHELRQLLGRFDVPAVLVTHDAAEAVALADDAVIMIDGTVRQSGPVHEVFSRPIDPSVAKVVGVETIEPGVIVRISDGLATVRAGSAELVALAPSATAQNVHVCIRGEDVILERGPVAQTSARNQLAARITALSPQGPTVRVGLDCGFALTALVTRPACQQLDLHVGDAITTLIKAQAIHLVERS